MFHIDFLLDKITEKNLSQSKRDFGNGDSYCLIFRTSLQNKDDVKKVAQTLDHIPEIQNWSVDLDNWEKVLRVECSEIEPVQIIHVLRKEGIHSKEIPV